MAVHNTILLCIYVHVFFIHSSIKGHLGCFQVSAIVNSAAMSIGVHISFWITVLSRYMPGMGLLDHMATLFLVFWGTPILSSTAARARMLKKKRIISRFLDWTNGEILWDRKCSKNINVGDTVLAILSLKFKCAKFYQGLPLGMCNSFYLKCPFLCLLSVICFLADSSSIKTAMSLPRSHFRDSSSREHALYILPALPRHSTLQSLRNWNGLVMCFSTGMWILEDRVFLLCVPRA